MLNILFLGGYFDKNYENYIQKNSKGSIQYAANKFQKNLINGFLKIDNIKLNIISAPFIGDFPKNFKKMRIKGSKILYKKNIKLEYIKFINFWGYRNISRKINLKKAIKKFAKSKENNKIIIIYSMHTPLLKAAYFAKKIDPTIHLCLVIPDLPQFMNLSEEKSLMYSLLKKVDIKISERIISNMDSFVLLTEYMKNKINISKKPYIVVEGIVDPEDYIGLLNDFENLENQTILYTGTLNKKYGVLNLIEAFSQIDNNNVNLILCGKGDTENIIQKYIIKDHRIKYLGQLSNEKILTLQKKATILINPRQDNEDFTKYSFPSKNMEYLMSGNPVICYKLKGIPDEYDDFFIYVKNNSINDLKKVINDVLSWPNEKRKEFGKRAKNFLLKKKNNVEISKKILKLIKNSKE